MYDVIGVEAMGWMLRCGRMQEEVDFAAELRQLAPGLSQAAARLNLELWFGVGVRRCSHWAGRRCAMQS